ncbi:hypothetical protein [Rhodococcus sp. UFZ-B548]|uniref:hypothetical protein n=2 Tax=unclassified Rhodococcus (in: high G+C Gram-positive bacteria) TaxID=192944 RepID=UPI0015F48C1A|nr:hypothetical protein [Rhodococcus sp. UFZ-B548]
MAETDVGRSTGNVAVRVVRQQRTAVQQELTAALDAFHEPVTGSPRARDAAWLDDRGQREIEGLKGIFGIGVEHTAELLRVAREHSVAIEILLDAEEILPIPMMSLVRSVHEALLEACWLTDPAIGSDQRIARAAAACLASVQGNLSPLNQLPNTGIRVAEVQESVEGMHALLKQFGFDLRYDKAGALVTAVIYGEGRAALKINVTELNGLYMPGSEHMWSLGSGGTHSRHWFTAGLEGSRDLLAIMIVAPMLDFVDAAIDNIHGYLGLPTREFHKRAHQRRIALLSRRNEEVSREVFSAGYDEYAAARIQPRVSAG